MPHTEGLSSWAASRGMYKRVGGDAVLNSRCEAGGQAGHSGWEPSRQAGLGQWMEADGSRWKRREMDVDVFMLRHSLLSASSSFSLLVSGRTGMQALPQASCRLCMSSAAASSGPHGCVALSKRAGRQTAQGTA